MIYYLKTDKDKIIRDLITYEHEDYEAVELDIIPDGLYSGWFKYENGEIVEYPDLNPSIEDDEIKDLKRQISDLEVKTDQAVMELTMIIAMGGMS